MEKMNFANKYTRQDVLNIKHDVQNTFAKVESTASDVTKMAKELQLLTRKLLPETKEVRTNERQEQRIFGRMTRAIRKRTSILVGKYDKRGVQLS